jgi:hypothetical protein
MVGNTRIRKGKPSAVIENVKTASQERSKSLMDVSSKKSLMDVSSKKSLMDFVLLGINK